MRGFSKPQLQVVLVLPLSPHRPPTFTPAGGDQIQLYVQTLTPWPPALGEPGGPWVLNSVQIPRRVGEKRGQNKAT